MHGLNLLLARDANEMILSHRHKFIFIKPKKVGGTSIEIALSKFCGPEDVLTPISPKDEANRENLGFVTKQRFRKGLNEYSKKDLKRLIFNARRAKKFYNHMTAREIKAAVSEEVWDSYTKISVVRSPYERAISRYFWVFKGETPDVSFKSYLRENLGALNENRLITHIDGVSAVDCWVQFESMDEGLSALGERLGFGDEICRLLHEIHAKKGIRPKEATASALFEGFDDGLQQVQDICRGDIEEWGYELS